MKKKQPMENRPNYYHGQLLVEKDFLAEQDYHVRARRRHNLRAHGNGIVSGLEVVRKSESSIVVHPGYALDSFGREIFLDNAEEIDLSEFGPNDIVNVSLMFQEEEQAEGGAKHSAINRNSIAGFAVIVTATAKEDPAEVLLAKVKLNAQKKVSTDAIDYSQTRYASAILAPGWLRMPFRPIGLANIPEGEDEFPPAFRVGATEALSPKPEKTDSKDKGAAGTMAIILPPSVTKILRFRIAGSRNEGKITFSLLAGGWNPDKNEHVNRELIKEKTITGAPFLETYLIEDHTIDPEYATLSLWLRCTQRAAISLVAVQVGY